MDDFKPFDFTAGGNASDAGPIDAAGDGGSSTAFFLGGTGTSGSGNVDSSGDAFDPERHVARDKFNGDGTFRKRRGRKSGGANSTRSGNRGQAGYKANIDSLTSILAIVHAGLASATKTPELALDQQEAEALANAAANFLIEFDIQPNPKVQAIVGLVMTAGSIYGPRVYLIRERKKKIETE